LIVTEGVELRLPGILLALLRESESLSDTFWFCLVTSVVGELKGVCQIKDFIILIT